MENTPVYKRLALAAIVALALIGAVPATTQARAAAAAGPRITITHAGVYHVPGRNGHIDTITVTAGPATRTASPNGAASYWCRGVSWTWNTGSYSDFLYSAFCWNYSTAVSYGGQTRCATGPLPFGTCYYSTVRYVCAYCQKAGTEGVYYNGVFGWPSNDAIVLSTDAWGNWWGFGWAI